MAVIKSPGAEAPRPRPVISAEVAEASQEAKRIIAEANAKAAQIVADAHAQGEQVVRDYQTKGRQEGLAMVAGEIAKAKVQAGELLKSSEREIVELALRIAEKIIGTDLERDRTVLLDICANAVETLRNAKQMTLRLNPKDSSVLRQNRPQFMERLARSIDVAIKDDSDVQPGGCVIQTEFGTIDAQLSTQLAMLKDVLIDDGAKKEGPA